MISIASLIYKSPRYADSVYDSLWANTEELQTGKAEFYFVANNATIHLMGHLVLGDAHYYVQRNRHRDLEWLRKKGYDGPEYMHSVYKGWNRAILEAQEIVVLVNSDMMFSKGWLAALLANLNDHRVVCSQLVERKHPNFNVFPGAYNMEFGDHPDNFKEREFQEYCKAVAQFPLKLREGGAYMPCCLYKHAALRAGLYPEGNPKGTFGDQEFFKRLAADGVQHVTVMNSLVYHFKEGEKDSDD